MSARGLRRLPISPGKLNGTQPQTSSSTCAVALFLLGLNIGLSFLLIVLVAGHLQPSNLDQSEYIPGNVQGQMFLRKSEDIPVADISNQDGLLKHALPSEVHDTSIPLTTIETITSTISSPCKTTLSTTSLSATASTKSVENSTQSPLSHDMMGTSQIHEVVSRVAHETSSSMNDADSRLYQSATARNLSIVSMSTRRNQAELACRQGKCKIYYVHIHKSGGTTLCSMAGFNGMKINLATNCLEKDKGKPVTFWKFDTQEQVTWLMGRSVDFIANEGGSFDVKTVPLPRGVQDTNPGLAFVITVRNPLDRVLSHYRHERNSPKSTQLKEISFAEFVQLPEFIHWRSNFYVRLLGGCGWELQCEESHLESAKNALDWFSAVLITDDELNYQVGAKLLLHHRLGWNKGDPTSKRKGTKVNSRASVELSKSPKAYAALIGKNDYDIKFYRQAVAIFHRQLVEVIREEVVIDVKQSPEDREKSSDSSNVEQVDISSSSRSRTKFDIFQTLNTEIKSIDAVLSGRKNMLHEDLSSTTGTSDADMSNMKNKDKDKQFIIHSDRSGFGGHTSSCKGYGGMELENCQHKLITLVSSGCSVLSYKDGQCYLHNSKRSDFYTDTSMGHQFLELRV